MTPRRRFLVFRVLAIFIAAVFVRAGFRKLLGAEETISHFEAWGYPRGLMLLVGVIELTGAALLPFFRTLRAACVLLVPIMLGAIGTQLVFAAYAKAIAPAVVLGLLVFLATRKLNVGGVAWQS